MDQTSRQLGLILALLGTACGGSSLTRPNEESCVAPRCLTTLAKAQQRPLGIAVDSNYVYWTDQLAGTVTKAPLDGGDPIVVTSDQNAPSLIAVDGNGLYWTNFGARRHEGSVMALAFAAGAPVELASAQDNAQGIAVSGSTVYWTEAGDHTVPGNSGSIKSVHLDGSSPTTILSGSGNPLAIAVDDTNIYWTHYDVCPPDSTGACGAPVSSVVKLPVAGGAPVTLASSPVGFGIALDAANVYWVATSTGDIMKVPKDGGTPTTLASGQSTPADVVVDSADVYWANLAPSTATGSLNKVSASGGDTTMLAAGQSEPGHLAVDATSVYWTNTTAGTVMRLTPK
jgi:hypothetical protein